MIKEKQCTVCNKTKSIQDFSKCYRIKSGYRSNCKFCYNNKKKLERKQRYKSNPNLRRKEHLRKKYGMSWEDYKKMWIEQEGCCAICKTYQLELKSILCVDHNHTTNQVRGLLCHSCNHGIGKFRDKISLLQSAIDYLKKNSLEFNNKKSSILY